MCDIHTHGRSTLSLPRASGTRWHLALVSTVGAAPRGHTWALCLSVQRWLPQAPPVPTATSPPSARGRVCGSQDSPVWQRGRVLSRSEARGPPLSKGTDPRGSGSLRPLPVTYVVGKDSSPPSTVKEEKLTPSCHLGAGRFSRFLSPMDISLPFLCQWRTSAWGWNAAPRGPASAPLTGATASCTAPAARTRAGAVSGGAVPAASEGGPLCPTTEATAGQA